MDESSPQQPGSSLADRLNALFDKVRKPDGTPYSLREVADAVTAAGDPISHAFIGHLRSGRSTDPTLRHMKGLARFFGVPVEYFTSDAVATEVDEELLLAAALQQVRARTVALRRSVVPQAQEQIGAIAELLRVIADLEQRRGTDSDQT
ncbi:XRE family transcriptional regulator [Actinoplanes sp. NPDC049548]|uniref:XRE family transcriptional regulator n=1 Tax=Actinoplanes sp. NPDC049548 TaxID=3155152 RepID=UPI003422CD51